MNNASSLGSTTSPGTLTFAGGSIDNENVNGLSFANPIVFNGSGTYNATSNYSMTFTGAVSLGTAPGPYRSIGVNNAAAMILNGVISNGTTTTSSEKSGGGKLAPNAQHV